MTTDPLLPEQPSTRYTLTAKQVGLIVRAGFVIGFVIGFVMGMALAVTSVHFLTR